MSGSSISAIIASVALVLLILGFLFGWMRGYQKSLTRLIIVLIVAVAAFFITPLFTETVLNFNISGFNIRINGELMTSVRQFITATLNSIQEVREALEASPTLEAFILALPAMIVNTILFTIIFFLLKWISMAIYAIFAFTVFSKKKLENKNKIKLLGAGIGVVQALVAILVILVPVFGYVAIGSSLAETAEAVSATSAAYSTASTYTENTASTPSISLDEAAGYVNKYTAAFDNTWVVKVYRAVGADKLSIAVFNELSKQKVNGIETNISKELTTVSKLAPIAAKFANTTHLEINNELADALSDGIDIVYGEDGGSPILGQIINEVAQYAAEKLANDEEFLHIKISNITEDEKIVDIIKTVCNAIVNTDAINLKSDLKSAANVLSVLINDGVVEAVKSGGEVKTKIMEILSAQDKTLVADLIDALEESSIATSVLPKVINTGLDYVYDALGTVIPADPTEAAAYKINENINGGVWASDKNNIQTVFANVAGIYKQYQDAQDASEDFIKYVNFESFGAALDSMRKSAIISVPGGKLLESILNSDMISAVVPAGTRTTLLDAWSIQEGEAGYVNYASTFKGIGEMVAFAQQMSEMTPENISENLDAVIETIKDGDVDPAVLQSIVTTENLTQAGLNATDAQAIADVVDLYAQAQQADSENKVELTSEQATGIINSIAGSDMILDVIANNELDNINELINTDMLHPTAKTNLKNALDTAVAGADETKAAKLSNLYAMLGLTA